MWLWLLLKSVGALEIPWETLRDLEGQQLDLRSSGFTFFQPGLPEGPRRLGVALGSRFLQVIGPIAFAIVVLF